MEYLDFELPIKELEEQLEKCVIIGKESDVDVTPTCKEINKKLVETKKTSIKTLPLGNVFSYPDILIVPIHFRSYSCPLRRYFFRIARRSRFQG